MPALAPIAWRLAFALVRWNQGPTAGCNQKAENLKYSPLGAQRPAAGHLVLRLGFGRGGGLKLGRRSITGLLEV